MLEYFKNKIYFNETLKNKYKTIIELFVIYYGENFRDLITKKIDNTTIVCYYPNASILEDLSILRSQKGKDLASNFLDFIDNSGYNFDKQAKDIFDWFYFPGYLRGNSPLRYIENYLISKNCSYEIKYKAFLYLKKFDNSLTIDNIDQKKQNGEFDFLKTELIPKYKELIQDWVDYQKQFSWVTDMAKDEEKFNNEILMKNWKKFINEICSKFIPEDEIKIINETDAIDEKEIPTTCFFVGYLFDDISFNLNAKILTMDFLSSPELEKDAISVFKMLGFDYGDDISIYLQNPEVNKTIDLIKDIYILKEDYKKNADYEFIENSVEANVIINQIKAKNPLYTDPIDEAIYLLIQKGAAGSLMFDISKDTMDINPILTIDLSDKLGIDKTLIHELNHRLEMEIIEKSNEVYEYACGWQKGKKSDNESSLDSKYKWINEVTNEMISIEIMDLMEKNNISIFGKRNVDKQFDHYNKESSYDKGIILLKEFFVDNFESIISSRLKGDINIIYEEVGRENFENFNDLINYFFKEYEGINYINLSEDLKLGKETDLTRKYQEILNKKNVILQNIKNYKKQK